MAIDVVGAGLMRTGTQSLLLALRALGYHSVHGKYFHDVAELTEPWSDWLRGGAFQPALDALLRGGYNATLDVPFSLAWRELMSRFPSSKVILTEHRTPEAWYSSLMRVRRVEWREALKYPYHRRLLELKYSALACPFAESPPPEAKVACMEAYAKHTAEVKRSVPRERLLVFHLGDDWGPLCRFLGVPVPAVPFPRVDINRPAPAPAPNRSGIMVIGAGVMGTGTGTLGRALELLGYRTAGRESFLSELRMAEPWHDWLRGGGFEPALEALLQGGYTATLGLPFFLAWKELRLRFEDARVILTEVPHEQWLAELSRGRGSEWSRAAANGSLRSLLTAVYEAFSCPFLATIAPHVGVACTRSYRSHNREVKLAVPADRLLVFNVADGWGPLCRFLGVPIPRASFPEIASPRLEL